jgi:hypothetical protein
MLTALDQGKKDGGKVMNNAADADKNPLKRLSDCCVATVGGIRAWVMQGWTRQEELQAVMLSRKPASKDPRYRLASLYGAYDFKDPDIQQNSRLTWNRFMSKWLSENQREGLLKLGQHSANELTPLDEAELVEVAKRLEQKGVSRDFLDKFSTTPWLHFRELEFQDDVHMEGYIFPFSVSFDGCSFRRYTHFNEAIFVKDARFLQVEFHQFTYFDDATSSAMSILSVQNSYIPRLLVFKARPFTGNQISRVLFSTARYLL